MTFAKALLAASALVAAPILASSASAQNIVANGGFEDGFNNWVSAGWFTTGSQGGVAPFEGGSYASTGCTNPNSPCTLSQTLATVAGGRYDISFAFAPGCCVANGGGSTSVYFGSTLLTTITGGDNGWTTYNFTNVAGSGTSTTLVFAGYQIPAWNGVDAVSVQASSGAVPEPASWAMMLGGFGAIGGALRSRRKAAVSFA